MRRSREETAEDATEHIVKTAGISFPSERDLPKTGLADLMESAGPDARRVSTRALRLEGPTRSSEASAGRVSRPKSARCKLPPPRPGGRKALEAIVNDYLFA